MTEGTPAKQETEIERPYTPIEQAIIAERVRIWNGIFRAASVQPWTEGSKRTLIITIGEPKLKEIVLPTGLNPAEPDFDPVHPSQKPMGAKAIEHDKNQK